MSDVTVAKGHLKFAKRTLSTLRKMQYEGFNPHDDVDVVLLGVRGVSVKPPFKASASSFLASLVIVESLSVVSNAKSGSGLLDPVALAAICLGQRVATRE